MTIYARRRRQGILASLTFLVLAAVAHSHGADGLAVVLLVLGVTSIAVLARRPRLSADTGGITVANLLRTVHVPWSEITGFGFGSTGTVSCLQIHRRNSPPVSAWVLSDGARGYPPERLQEIVSDLRERLAAATGTVDRGDAAPSTPDKTSADGGRKAGWAPHVMWVLVCGFLLVFGAATTWHAWKDLPHAYSRLRAEGVPATARFAGCSVVDLRTHHCRLTLTYRGTTRTWTYPQDYPQFLALATGAPVPVLVDPDHPSTVYTAHDVEAGYDAGLGGLSVFGVAVTVLGAIGLAFSLWLLRLSAAAGRRTAEGGTGLRESSAAD